MELDLEIAEAYIYTKLPEKYYIRSLDAANLMTMVANKYDLRPDQAKLAGLLHLVSRQMDNRTMIHYLGTRENKLMRRLPPEYKRTAYLTGPASAWFALEHLDQRSEDVFRGIREHTFLFKHPSPLGKCLFVATVLTRIERDDPRVAVLMRDFLSGKIDQVLTTLNRREICSLEKTDVRRLARITNPDMGDIS